MTTQFGLLEVLVSSNVVTSEQDSIIQGMSPFDLVHEENKLQLLKEIVRQTISDEKNGSVFESTR